MTRTAPPRMPAGPARLYQMSAERALAAIPAGSISVLLTDPPYTSVNRRGGSGSHLQRWFPGGLSWTEIGRILAVARRKLRADGVAFVMVNGDGLRDALGALQRAGFPRVRTITWDRQYPGLGGGLRHQTEFVLVGLLPGSRTLTGVDLVSVPAVGPGTAGRYPTQKPDELGRVLARIANISPGDVVLDPFVGSGALLVGARERGAHVIGCDIAPTAIRTAKAKLSPAGTAKPARSSSSPRAPTGRHRPVPKGQPRWGL
jgi:site-specific DNA-methyltransferase (adenine-specific)